MTWQDLVPFIPEPEKPRVVKRQRREVQVAPAPAPAPKPQVEVIRGLQVTKQVVPGEPANDGAQKPAANE